MSYPDPRYHGDTGEASATHRDAKAPADYTYGNGTRVHYLATGASTEGRFGLYRWEMGPEASGPDPHFHRTMSESFYVLAGTVRIFTGTDWVDCDPGAFVHVPEGGIHGFRNESGQPATILIHFAPGAPREGYFEGIPGMATASDEERSEFYRIHDNHWV
ncbi:MAG TPA: cupin domain-containing protein [Candidatus Limnocylindria bacterium]|jgi:mannose-6-phosphate isomerase-like protein (cupin superfamily)